MRRLWNIISFLAVVHLLAIVMFVGWLWQTQRLTPERLHEAKAVFAVTVPEQTSAAGRAAAEAEAERRAETEALRQANPALDSASQVKFIALIQQQEEQSRRRLQDERRSLLNQMALNAEELKRKQQELDRLEAEWKESSADDRQRKNDEQFLQTVRQFEQLPPKQGKRMIIELINLNQFDQAVTYLAAMNGRAAGKIFKEFKTDEEIKLATQLLESMRTRGLSTEPSAAGESLSATTSGLAAAPQSSQPHALRDSKPGLSSP
jgi:hypothetical protein